MGRIKTVFFDAGNTLIYAHPKVSVIYSEVSKQFGADIDPTLIEDQFRSVFRKEMKIEAAQKKYSGDDQDKELWRRITGQIHSSIELFKDVPFDEWFEALYRRFGLAQTWRIFDDVEEVLGSLKKSGIRLGLISNWDRRLRGILDGLGLDKYMDYITVSSEIGVRKPHKEIFEHALSGIDSDPADAIHIGDLYDEDYLGARNIGIKPLLINRNRSSDIPPGCNSITSLTEILNSVTVT